MTFARKMVQHGGDRVQIGQWHSRHDVALLIPFAVATSISSAAVVQTIAQIRQQGYTSAYTSAMTPQQAAPFLAEGFEIYEELHLLRYQIAESPRGVPNVATILNDVGQDLLRRGRRSDYDEVIAFDRLAFDTFWRFDRPSLLESMRATPRHRFQVTRTDPIVGYHITGLAGRNAYLQRIAVHPNAQRQGWGRRLVDDCLDWAKRHGALQVHVNTQLNNSAAVALYERAGFELADVRLQVLALNDRSPALDRDRKRDLEGHPDDIDLREG